MYDAIHYDTVFIERIDRLRRLRAEPGLVSPLKQYYADNPIQFITDWGMTFDPRNPEVGLPAAVPFVIFERQEQFIRFVVEHWRGREDCLVEKSRDMGVSWLCCAIAVWMWLFVPGSVIGFGSRKEEYVDKIGDPKSLFWKIRWFIDQLPVEFQPAGWNPRIHAPAMRILNPETGAAIVGEAGDNIGRGNRTSIYFKDESAFYEHPDAIDAALSQTSNCKVDVSTPNGPGNPFYRKRFGGAVDVFTFHWRDDPRKSEDWYQKQRRLLDPVILAQEVDLDYNASVSDIFISGALVADAQGRGPADVEVTGGWIIGIDAAHMGDDETVITMRRGSLVREQICRRQVDGPQIAAMVGDFCQEAVEAGGFIHAIVVELDGPGVSTYDALRASKWKQYIHGVHTGARRTDGRNYNVKAWMCRRAKEWLEQGGRSMPRDPTLHMQIASIRQAYKNGELIMQPKKENKKLLGRSPDRADSFFLTFAAPDTPKGDAGSTPEQAAAMRRRRESAHAQWAV